MSWRWAVLSELHYSRLVPSGMCQAEEASRLCVATAEEAPGPVWPLPMAFEDVTDTYMD